MREIQFRYWNDNTQVIHYSFNYENICGKQFVGDGSVQYEVDGKEIVVMQYTGLQDRNGKGIYEGDLLGYDENPRFVSKVIYEEGRFLAKQLHTGGQDSLFMMVNRNGLDLVVGNIYENPELLSNQ